MLDMFDATTQFFKRQDGIHDANTTSSSSSSTSLKFDQMVIMEGIKAENLNNVNLNKTELQCQLLELQQKNASFK